MTIASSRKAREARRKRRKAALFRAASAAAMRTRAGLSLHLARERARRTLRDRRGEMTYDPDAESFRLRHSRPSLARHCISTPRGSGSRAGTGRRDRLRRRQGRFASASIPAVRPRWSATPSTGAMHGLELLSRQGLRAAPGCAVRGDHRPACCRSRRRHESGRGGFHRDQCHVRPRRAGRFQPAAVDARAWPIRWRRISPIWTTEDIDKAGMRIGVTQGSTSERICRASEKRVRRSGAKPEGSLLDDRGAARCIRDQQVDPV